MAEQNEHKTSSIKKLTISRGGWIQINRTEGRKCEYALEVETDEKHFTENFNFYDIFLKHLVTKVLSLEKETRDNKVKERTKPQRRETTDMQFDLNKIQWQHSQGKSGPFERSVDRDNPEFKKVVNALLEQRTMVVNGWYVWLFKDDETLGKKPSR